MTQVNGSQDTEQEHNVWLQKNEIKFIF